MLVKAQAKFLRISPTKTGRVINLLRGKDVLSAMAILCNIKARPREYLKKILDSAVANAKIKGFGPEQLYISRIICDNGPAWKRYRAAAFGRAAPIKKRTSHIKVELDLKNL